MVALTNYNYKEFLTNDTYDFGESPTDNLIILYFWSPYDNACQDFFTPIFDELEGEYYDKPITFAMIDDQQDECFYQYNVNTVPTILMIQNGFILHKIENCVSKGQISDYIDHLLYNI